MDTESFAVYFQPQVDLSEHRISGFEALMRWQQAEGDVLPDRFIAVAEETGLIIPIGEIVLRKTCEQMQVLHEAGFVSQKVSVNLSRRQFFDKHLINMVERILKETNFETKGLEFEITEGMLMNDVERAIETMTKLKLLGVSIAIDGFGTGISSLTTLARLPVDKLKVDRSFINELSSNQGETGIASAVSALAQHMNLIVAAEGVENAAQLDFLKKHNCSLQQGFLFCAPVSLAELIPKLSSLQDNLKEQSSSIAQNTDAKALRH